ncbi:MAG TPA: lysylphosphatidylglycerol synthase transmembrane domain-containing protein [Dehalococcoidia bacterium]|nr:lysylphosphatidylglycerol synthase transmembrane domain-containing protein [Dehalococcoidia bacterium]
MKRLLAKAWHDPIVWRLARILFSLGIAAGFGYVFVQRADLDQVWESLGDLKVAILLGAVAFYFFNVWFQAMRWHFLIKHLGSPGSLKLVPPMLIGVMGNNILPLRLGIVLRAEYLWSRFRINAPAAFSTVIIEGWLDGVVLALVFVPALALIGTEQGIIRGILISGGIAAGALLLLRLAFTERVSAFWRKHAGGLPRLPTPRFLKSLLGPLVRSFLTGMVSIRSNYILAQALFWTTTAWLARAVELYLVGLAFGLGQPFPDYLVLTAALSASGIIQVSPGNTGPYEFVAAEIMTRLGAERGDAAAFAIISHVVLYAPVTLVGGITFAWHRLTLRQFQERQRIQEQAGNAGPPRTTAASPSESR